MQTYDKDSDLIYAMADLWVENNGDADGFYMLQEAIYLEIKRRIEHANV